MANPLRFAIFTMLIAKVRATIQKQGLFRPGEMVVVAVSGGPDSLCLLHVLCQLQDELGLTLHVAHLDHGLRGEEAAADAAFVAGLARDWGLPAAVETADVRAVQQTQRLSMEEAARYVRYAFLARVAATVGTPTIAAGHTADDQVETILIHFLRGAGLAGLRGMLPVQEMAVRPLRADLAPSEEQAAPIRLVRPLLEVTRAEVEDYCAAHGLTPRHDRSNEDEAILRNRLRWRLIPTLETYNPSLRTTMLRAARALADDYAYLQSEVARLWPALAQETADAVTFDLAAWRGLPPALQRHLLREAVARRQGGWQDVGAEHIEKALAMAEKRVGAQVALPNGLRVSRSYTHLIVGRAAAAPMPVDQPLLTVEQLSLAIPGVTPLPGSPWQVQARVVERTAGELPPPAPYAVTLDLDAVGSDLMLRRRRPGDRFQPLGLGGSQKLQDFFVDHKVPREWRDLVPIVATPRQIVWVVGYRLDARAQVTAATRRLLSLSFTQTG
jgi:tRNA(Ile)-lysidine synthase